jgi:aldose sugar dehydrogenase
MQFRLIQFVLLALVSACGASPSSRAAGAPGERPFTVTEVANFDSPWAMDFLPGSGVRLTTAALVTEKSGKLWLVATTTGAKQEVLGLPPIHVEGQGGLADVVADPGFAGNHRVYLSFVEAGANGSSGAVVGYGRLVLGNGQIIPDESPSRRMGPCSWRAASECSLRRLRTRTSTSARSST